MNFLWKREEREREGVGVSCGEGKGLVSKIPNWEGKEKGGPTPSPRHHEFVKPPSPSVCTHTHTSAEEALHSQWVESWSSNCAETSLPFRFSLCLCLHLGCWDKPNVDPDVTWLEVLSWFQKNLKVPSNIFFFPQFEPTLTCCRHQTIHFAGSAATVYVCDNKDFEVSLNFPQISAFLTGCFVDRFDSNRNWYPASADCALSAHKWFQRPV